MFLLFDHFNFISLGHQAIEVARGLQYLHGNEIVHGDLRIVCRASFCAERATLTQFRITF